MKTEIGRGILFFSFRFHERKIKMVNENRITKNIFHLRFSFQENEKMKMENIFRFCFPLRLPENENEKGK